jgi:hypothetical protein
MRCRASGWGARRRLRLAPALSAQRRLTRHWTIGEANMLSTVLLVVLILLLVGALLLPNVHDYCPKQLRELILRYQQCSNSMK